MKFYSGFSLKNEEYLFEEYINSSDYCVCGFSYGAIKALEYVQEQLKLEKRVDTLQLLSPAFFQTKDKKFKRLQLMAYKKSQNTYLRNFMDSCFAPHSKKIVEHSKTAMEELDKLLNYEWNVDELNRLAQKGVEIEVYLGSEDKIIDVESARELFLQVSTVTYIKNANHFLQIQ